LRGDRPGHLGEEPLGLQDEGVQFRRRREDVRLDHVEEAFPESQNAIGFLPFEDRLCFFF